MDNSDRLWAPWRLDYVKTPDEKRQTGCFLCRYRDADPATDAENYVISRNERTISVLNRFPYNNGHLLIAPRAHKADITELEEDELLECGKELQRLTSYLRELMNPDGFNIGLNLGRAGGAGLPGHLHWHIVPRWNGDTNFMPVVGDTKVIPQSLDALYTLLTESPSS